MHIEDPISQSNVAWQFVGPVAVSTMDALKKAAISTAAKLEGELRGNGCGEELSSLLGFE